jgi:hypothetical protein
MLVGREHNNTLGKISKWDIKWVISGILAFSLLMNIGHIFEYRINYGWGFSELSYYAGYSVKTDIYPTIVERNLGLGVYTLLYFIINFVFFFLVNTVVEMSLVLNMRQEIAEKRTKVEAEIQTMINNNTSESAVINKVVKSKLKKVSEDAKKETKVIVMVILNSVINFILRVPEIFVFMSGSSGLIKNNVFADFFMSILYLSNMMVSISYLAYVLTFSTNVAIYYFFNLKFKQAFIFWTSYVKKK